MAMSVSENTNTKVAPETKTVNEDTTAPLMMPQTGMAAGPAFPLPPSASLYVGELHPDVTEALLYDLFSQVGPVASVRVCRDAITRRSLGYAYVNFHNVEDGERALDALNYHPIKGHAIRIMWSQRDPSLRRSGAGNVFIKNLEKSIDNKALHDTFSAFGNILSCKVVTDDYGVSRGFGFVHFETAEAAQEAIAKVNGMLLNDEQVFVGPHLSRRERVSKIEENKAKFTNVYIKNLDESVDEATVTALFSKYGEITSILIQRDPETQQSKGFGFINFASHDAAAKAIANLHDTELNGKLLFVCRAQSKIEREDELRRQYDLAKQERISKFQGVNLYMKNLEESIDEEALRALFEPYGTISSLKIMRDDKGASRGFGFVCFGTPEEAQKALSEMNGRMLKEKPLYVSFAQRKEERQSFLEAQYHQRLQYRQFIAAQQAGFPGAAFPPGMMPRPQGMYPRRPVDMGAAPQGPAAFSQGGFPASNQNMFPGAPNGMNMPQRFQRNVGFRQSPRAGYMPRIHSMFPGASPAFRQRMPNQQGMSGSGHFRPFHRRYPPMMPGQNMPDSRGPNSLTPNYLASLPVEAQKQVLGEHLFPLVFERESTHAQKITGMLLEMDNGELLHLLESPDTLHLKINEAISSINHTTSSPDQPEASA